MIHHALNHPKHGNVALSGVTVIEVLMSILIMGIGVSLVASLIPISVLRTAQATQLTHATLLRNNVQALIESTPSVLGNLTVTPGANVTVGATTYPSMIAGTTYAVIDPLGVYLVGAGAAPASNTAFWWTTAPVSQAIPRLSPYGVSNFPAAAQTSQLPDSWSTILEAPATYTAGSPPTLTVSSNATVPTLICANSYNVNQATVNFPSYSTYRMAIFDSNLSRCVIKPLLQASGQVISWWDVNSTTGASLASGTSLPSNFTPVRVRIDVQQRRYTWLMTVKKVVTDSTQDAWTADADVAVFYNRSFKLADEASFSATFVLPSNNGYGFDQAAGVKNVDDDGNGYTDWTDAAQTIPDPAELGWPGSDDNRTLAITYAAAGTAPAIKKGSFLLEPSNLVWYRIVDYSTSGPVAGNYTTTVLLDTNVQYDATIGGGTASLAAIFMKGIVDVYPLGTISGQQ